MFIPKLFVLVAIATVTNARTVSDGTPLLIDQVYDIANALPTLINVDTTVPPKDAEAPGVYIPGRSNICDALCPKWCQKINGTATDNTNCHYLCGNICFDKNTYVNPFIGNSRYEVVPSEFNFSRYDLNGDKLISAEEFARTEGVNMDEVLDLFLFADVNGDGFIDTQEFQGGPLVFTVQMAAEMSAMALEMKEKTTMMTPTTV